MRQWAALHEDVVFGRSGGRIIWQPRILCWYTDKQFVGEPLPAPYTGLPMPEIYRKLGCSDRLYNWYNPCFRRVEDPGVQVQQEPLNETDTRITIHTPAGAQVAVHRRTPNSWHHISLKREVESEAELKVAAWREERATWEWDQQAFDRAQREVGDLGAPAIFMPRMNVQSLYIEKMGVEGGVFAMHDWPDTTAVFFAALEACHDRLIELFAPKLVLGISDEISSTGDIERVRLVGDIVEEYNARCK